MAPEFRLNMKRLLIIDAIVLRTPQAVHLAFATVASNAVRPS